MQEEMHCYYIVVFWEAALHNEIQMKPTVTKSVENPVDLPAQRWTRRSADWRCHRPCCHPCSAVQQQQYASPVTQCYPKILLCFTDLHVNLLHFVFTYMWAGKVIKGRWLFVFPLSSVAWCGSSWGTAAAGLLLCSGALIWVSAGAVRAPSSTSLRCFCSSEGFLSIFHTPRSLLLCLWPGMYRLEVVFTESVGHALCSLSQDLASKSSLNWSG